MGALLRKPWWRLLPLGDGVALLLAGAVAHWLRFRPEDRLAHLDRLAAHPGFLVAAWAAMWAVATAAELYHHKPLARWELASRVGFAAALWAVALVVLTYANPAWRFGRGLLLLTAASWGVLAWVLRAVQGGRQKAAGKVLIVGGEEERERLAQALGAHPASPWVPEAVPSSELPGALGGGEVAMVVVAGGEKLTPELVAWHFAGVPVVAEAEVWAALEGRLPVDRLPPELFLHQREFGAIHWEVFNRTTRVIDVLVASLLLVLALPLLAVVALLVLVCDGRPVLYRQLRLGQYGKPFVILKFRTMRRDAEANGPEFEGENDPRVTRLGRILRRFRLDELPQLWNVLRGEMSLVGPRPERPEFVRQLAEQIPYYTFRLAVPPGITGWAQVNMPYARTLEEHKRKLEYDLYFIRERTLSLYLAVLLRTASAALFGVRR